MRIRAPRTGKTDRNDEIVAESIYRLGETSCKMEEARYSSLLSSSSHILSCVSIASIALITLLPVAIEGQEATRLPIIPAYVLVFLFLLASFFVSLLAQYRFKYIELMDPVHLANHTNSQKHEFNSRITAATYFCSCLEEFYMSIRKRNELISSLVKASAVLLAIAIALVSVAVVVVAVDIGVAKLV